MKPDTDGDVTVSGAYDLHVHAGPCIFERWGDAWDLAEACAAASMAGFVLKSHHGSTVESAHLLRARYPGLQIHGGVTLNAFVGGVNPFAVEAAVALGGKVVWLPTLHAAHHAERCGCLGGFGFQRPASTRAPASGYSALAGTDLREEVHDVLSVLHDRPVVLGTGHLSRDEILAVAAAIRDRHLRVRLLVNHVLFEAPKLDRDDVRALRGEGVWFELAYLSISPLVACTTPATVADYIHSVPDAQWIMVSDSGQPRNPPSPVALGRFAAALQAEGVTAARIDSMLRAEPARLLCP